MKTHFISLLFIASLLHLQAGTINAIAVIVNDYPITLVDIDTKMEELKVVQEKAISVLIDEALYIQSLEKYRVTVDTFDVDNYIDKIAKNNKMSSFEFKNAIKQQEDYEKFVEKIKLELRHQKLITAIASNKLIIANEEDLNIYYNNNISQFKIAKKIDAIHYSAKDKNFLEALKKNPMMPNSSIEIKNTTFNIEVSPQMKYIISQTKEKTFSSIFPEDKTYNMIYVSTKHEIEDIPFETVKDTIFNTIMTNRESEYLKTYFENLKVSADIKILK